MSKKKVLVISDLGGCPPHMFYRSLAEKYHVISYVPRPFALTTGHSFYMEQYSAAVIKDTEYLNTIEDYVHPTSIYWATDDYKKTERQVVDDIKRIATSFQVEAITTNNELFIVPLAIASEELGLRGAGSEAAKKARDKNLMRESFNASGLTAIKSARVNTLEQFESAIAEIGLPAILKPSYLASSIGVRLIDGSVNPSHIFREVQHQLKDIPVPDSVTYEAQFIVETFLQGEYDDWYEQEGYADYVSVEGLMVEGTYYPLAINDKTPMIPPFVETSHITPTVLDAAARDILVETARKANVGLGLQNCATHTEIKLMKGKVAGIIETAARFGGWNIIPQIKTSFGVDAPQLLIDVLVNGTSEHLPKSLLTVPNQYSANLHLFLSDFRSSPQTGPNQSWVFESLEIPQELLVGNTKITTLGTIDAGTPIQSDDFFEALHALASLDLVSDKAEDLLLSLQNIRSYSMLRLTPAAEFAALTS